MTEEGPGCVHHLHLAVRRGDPEPTLVCSCPVGLVHMHDCPVMNGRACRHFEKGAGAVLESTAYEVAHTDLMGTFLSRPYLHRVRSLAQEGDAWTQRREDIERRYAEEVTEDPAGEDLTPEQEERYAQEKERLIAQRKRREEARAEREAKTREEKARERAKMGIKTVVERAQESVAARGNVSDSIVDEMPAPSPAKKKRRRRRRSGADQESPKQEPGKPAEGESTPRRRRRRRRRRRGPRPEGGGSA